MLACSMRVKPRERERRIDTRIRQYDNSTIRQYVNTSIRVAMLDRVQTNQIKSFEKSFKK